MRAAGNAAICVVIETVKCQHSIFSPLNIFVYIKEEDKKVNYSSEILR